MLTFKTGSITFKDSLCFLPFPLVAFPSTFDIKETSLARATRSNQEEGEAISGKAQPVAVGDSHVLIVKGLRDIITVSTIVLLVLISYDNK